MKPVLTPFTAALLLGISLAGCKPASQPESSAIPAKDRIDNTAEVEAVAAKAKPTPEQVAQYNKDEAEMIDASSKTHAETISVATFVGGNGQTVVATYLKNNTVRLVLADGSTKVLPQAVSGSGSRYADDHAEWWEHQGEATYSVNEKEVFKGKLKK